ncbi:MAG: hypothetical protein ACPG1A_13270 [Halioglobus sp.]
MLKLPRFLAEKRDLLQLRRELEALRRENAVLREKNESMREGMRRCVTCEYRLDYKARQGDAPIKLKN